jgi:hypothetical protein
MQDIAQTPPRKREIAEEGTERPKAKQRATSAPPPHPEVEADDGDISDPEFSNLKSAFYSTPDHAYGATALEISIEFDAWEFQLDDFDITQVLNEALLVSKTAKRKIEVCERKLTPAEKEEFRKAKAKEWNSFVDNRVVELASRLGLDARRIV